MCGIAGAIDNLRGRGASRVRAINEAQQHRGPDHSVVATVGAFTIGNTRLAIRDPSPAGNQPFASEDGRFHCVFNGEIYNYRQLIERFRLPVRTGCDGEIIPALWAKLGPDCLAEFRGMFAIAVVDSLQERIYLARDVFGIKPLYWRALADGSLCFASEIRPLIRTGPGVRPDSGAIARYLHLGAMASGQAPFMEVSALPANSVAAFDRNARVSVRPIIPDGPIATTRSAAEMASALTDSIGLHLAADVPTALLLSSGVDSATIAAVSRRLGQDLNCLTIAAPGTADESEGAARTARHYGHAFQRIPAAFGGSDVTRFFGAMQRPSIDGINTYVVSRAVHQAGFKVALSGLGGDEAVGGYSHFRLLKYLPLLRASRGLPDALAAVAARLLARHGVASEGKAAVLLGRNGPRDGGQLSLLQREVIPARVVNDMTGSDPLLAAQPPPPVGKSFGQQFMAMVGAETALYLQAMLLPDADAFSMTSSVELRVPFVDSHVFWASLRLAAATGKPPGKAAIGAALDDPYLQDLAARPKRGFSVPMRQWMSGPLRAVLEAANDPGAALWSVVDRAAAQRAGLVPVSARDRWAQPWALAVLNAWLETMDGR